MLVCGFQYPLKEVVVIHQDQEALKDIQSLQKYILEVSKQSLVLFRGKRCVVFLSFL